MEHEAGSIFDMNRLAGCRLIPVDFSAAHYVHQLLRVLVEAGAVIGGLPWVVTLNHLQLEVEVLGIQLRHGKVPNLLQLIMH